MSGSEKDVCPTSAPALSYPHLANRDGAGKARSRKRILGAGVAVVKTSWVGRLGKLARGHTWMGCVVLGSVELGAQERDSSFRFLTTLCFQTRSSVEPKVQDSWIPVHHGLVEPALENLESDSCILRVRRLEA